MNSTFKQMIHQIFQDEDLIEFCYINGIKTTCIQSSISNNVMYTEAGLVDGVNFTLDLEVDSLDRIPVEGDQVEYQDAFYKVASTEVDSANASMKLFLISLSKGA